MLEGIFGHASAEKALFYLEQYEEGYATAIAKAFDGTSLHMVQRQLERFERAGLLVSTPKGERDSIRGTRGIPFSRKSVRCLPRGSRRFRLRNAIFQNPSCSRGGTQSSMQAAVRGAGGRRRGRRVGARIAENRIDDLA